MALAQVLADTVQDFTLRKAQLSMHFIWVTKETRGQAASTLAGAHPPFRLNWETLRLSP